MPSASQSDVPHRPLSASHSFAALSHFCQRKKMSTPLPVPLSIRIDPEHPSSTSTEEAGQEMGTNTFHKSHEHPVSVHLLHPPPRLLIFDLVPARKPRLPSLQQ